MEKSNRKRVVCAMSGGIDSSMAAALLRRVGFDVMGVFMKLWSGSSDEGIIGSWNRCCSPEAEARARKVAKILKIPFYVLNFAKEFKKEIVDYFLQEHRAGRTPNPCVVCNKEIKFDLLFKKALTLDADFIATGHYARTNFSQAFLKNQAAASNLRNFGKIELLRGKDKQKDQSYFLWQLDQKQLKHILFPIGEYTKKEVKDLAKKFKLPVKNIPESMEICFIQTTVNDFLKKYLKPKLGPIVEQVHYGAKKIIGQHQGLWLYTIGQRRGIKLAGGPFWVLEKDLKNNALVVTKNEKDLYKKELQTKNVNWISGKTPDLPLKVRAKIRYRHKASLATVSKLKTKNYKLLFTQPQRAITPGQSVVFFRGQGVLGGGIII